MDGTTRVGFSRAGVKSKVDEAIRPKEESKKGGMWIQGVDEEGMDVEVDDAEEGD